MTDKIPTDLEAARHAYNELGKALETGEFSPPEAHHWKYRAANAVKAFMGACGWNVSGADPRVQTLQAALREAVAIAQGTAAVSAEKAKRLCELSALAELP